MDITELVQQPVPKPETHRWRCLAIVLRKPLAFGTEEKIQKELMGMVVWARNNLDNCIKEYESHDNVIKKASYVPMAGTALIQLKLSMAKMVAEFDQHWLITRAENANWVAFGYFTDEDFTLLTKKIGPVQLGHMNPMEYSKGNARKGMNDFLLKWGERGHHIQHPEFKDKARKELEELFKLYVGEHYDN